MENECNMPLTAVLKSPPSHSQVCKNDSSNIKH